MSAPDGGAPRPGLLDAVLFPDAIGPAAHAPREARAAGEPGDAAATPPARPGRRWARAAGAFVFWNLAQGIFLIPARGPAAPDAPVQQWYRPLIPPAWGALLNVLVALGFVWWFALRPAARQDARRRETFRIRALAPAARPWAAAAAALAAVAVNAALLVLPRVTALPREAPVIEHFTRLPNGALAVASLAVLVAPLLEEFFFRGWAQGALERRMAPWPAILVTAGVFAALHGLDAFGLVPRLALATGAGYAAWATRSIWPSVGLHAAYNAALFAGGAILPNVLPRPPRGEAWADAERAAYFFWAHDPRVFGPALVVLLLAAGGAAWALGRMGDAARAQPQDDPHGPPTG